MSLQRLNRWIKRTWPELDIDLWKVSGHGYFAWGGDDVHNQIGFEFESIYVYAFNHASMDWWKDEVRNQINAYLKAVDEHKRDTASEPLTTFSFRNHTRAS